MTTMTQHNPNSLNSTGDHAAITVRLDEEEGRRTTAMILAQRAAAARGGCVLSTKVTTTASSPQTATRLLRVRPRKLISNSAYSPASWNATTNIHWRRRRQDEGRSHDASCSILSLNKNHTQSSSLFPLLWSHHDERVEHDDDDSYRAFLPPSINALPNYRSINNSTSRLFSTKAKGANIKVTRKQPPQSKNKTKKTKVVFDDETTTSTKSTPKKKKKQQAKAKSKKEKQKERRQQRKSSRRRQRKRQLRIKEIQNNSILHHHSSQHDEALSSDDSNKNNTTTFQRQTEEDFGKLFDEVALDFTLTWTDRMCKKIKEKVHWLLLQQTQQAESSIQQSAGGDESDDNDNDDDCDNNHQHLFGTAVTQIVAVLLETTDPKDTLQIKILEQLLGIETTATPPAPSPNQKDAAEAVRSKQQQKSTTTATTPSYKPTREDYKLAALFMTARERAVRLQQPLFWNKQDLQQRQQQQQQHHEQQQQRIDLERRRLERHVAKSNQQLRDEALQLVLLLRTKLPKKYFEYVVNVFENYVGWNNNDSNDDSGGDDHNNMAAVAVEQPPKRKKTLEEVYELNQGNDSGDNESDTTSTASSSSSVPVVNKNKGHLPLRRLGKHMIRTARTHLFHVAEPVASFFYIIDDDDDDDTHPSLIATDPSLIHSRNRWNKSRRFFIKTMMELQDKMVTCIQEENDKTLASMQQKLDENKLPRPLDADDDDDERKAKGSKKKTRKKKKTKSSIDDEQLQIVATNQLKEELAESKRRRDEKEQESKDPKSKEKRSRGRPSRKLRVAHYVLDAMYVHESVNEQHVDEGNTDMVNGWGINGSSSTGRSSSSLLLPSQSRVLIDNLPIDITQEEVTQLYNRCGDLASVQLYNQRPDLDPGPLSRTELELRRKSQSVLAGRRRRRQQLQRQQRHQSWHRPKAPVYAMLTFEDSTGFDRAVDDTLRIFGMMIQRHPARSIRSEELQSLFIEPFVVPYSDNDDDTNMSRQNEADDRERRRANAADLVYEVGQLMGPDFLVSLESGHNHPNTQKVSMGSCEIKFPSFEVALEAYETLNRELSLFQHSNYSKAVKSADDDDDADNDQDTTLPMWTVNWIRTPRDALEWWTRKRGFDP